MASETLLPPHHQDADELKNQVEEATKTVEQEISLASSEVIKTDEGKAPKTVESSGSVEAPGIKSQDKVDDMQFDSLAAAEAEKVHHTPDSHGPEVDDANVADPNSTSFTHSKVEDVDKEQEAQSCVSDPPESSYADEVKKSQVPKLDAEMLQSTVNVHEVQKVSRVSELDSIGRQAEEGKTTASVVEEKQQEETVVEELKKNQDLEIEEKLSEQTNVLEELGNKQASVVEEKHQEQTGDLHGDTGNEATSIIEDISQGNTGILDIEAEIKPLTSEVEETQQAKVGVLEGEIGEKLELVEELDQKVTSEEETKTQNTSVLEEVGKKLEIPESMEPAIIGIVRGVGLLVDKIEEVSESLKEEHTVSVDEPAVSGDSVADVSLNENIPSDAKGVDDTNNEQSRTDEAEGLAKEVVEVGRMEETKNILDEKASKSEMLNSVEASDSSSHVEASKEPYGGEKASRDVGVTDEEEKEIVVKVDPIHATDSKELAGESKKLEPSYTGQSVEDTLDKVVEPVEETLKSDAANVEPSKDVNDLKTEGVDPKLEAPAKPTQKQSNNILSKVKHSIGKVKKAITGKSPSSKTISVDAKGDVNVK
ncbi:hypothetical protein Sjap_007112 [Stephania japonica]|uniref:Uncharacterized protein n=1 Tax=Stephania japonica TaxID=461633 RepID=A0AAP0JNN4_9MAGN